MNVLCLLILNSILAFDAFILFSKSVKRVELLLNTHLNKF